MEFSLDAEENVDLKMKRPSPLATISYQVTDVVTGCTTPPFVMHINDKESTPAEEAAQSKEKDYVAKKKFDLSKEVDFHEMSEPTKPFETRHCSYQLFDGRQLQLFRRKDRLIKIDFGKEQLHRGGAASCAHCAADLCWYKNRREINAKQILAEMGGGVFVKPPNKKKKTAAAAASSIFMPMPPDNTNNMLQFQQMMQNPQLQQQFAQQQQAWLFMQQQQQNMMGMGMGMNMGMGMGMNMAMPAMPQIKLEAEAEVEVEAEVEPKVEPKIKTEPATESDVRAAAVQATNWLQPLSGNKRGLTFDSTSESPRRSKRNNTNN